MPNHARSLQNVPVAATLATPRTPHPTRLGLGILLGLGASLAFATSGVFARPLFEVGWTPGAAVFWRVMVASVVMLPVAAWTVRGRWRVVAAEWRTVLAFGALAVATAQLMFFAAVDRMDVGIALLVEYMAPVLLVVVAWVRTRRRPAPLVTAGVVAAVAGLLCVLDLAGATPDPLGVLFALAAMVGAASYFVISARPSPLPPLALAGFGLTVGTVVLGLAIGVGALPYAAPMVEVTMLGATLPWWLPVAVVALVAAALAYSLGIAGVGLMGERLASFVSLSEVLFAVVLAALLLGEVPAPIQVAGGVLIVVGVVLVRLAAGRTESPRPPDQPLDAQPRPAGDAEPDPVPS